MLLALFNGSAKQLLHKLCGPQSLKHLLSSRKFDSSYPTGRNDLALISILWALNIPDQGLLVNKLISFTGGIILKEGEIEHSS